MIRYIVVMLLSVAIMSGGCEQSQRKTDTRKTAQEFKTLDQLTMPDGTRP
ncbi:MAG: hypothetical protein JXR97_16610 [Planctomycetes bacterium]|nr:hypothetical protein [Planctomycetota bacterium]